MDVQQMSYESTSIFGIANWIDDRKHEGKTMLYANLKFIDGWYKLEGAFAIKPK